MILEHYIRGFFFQKPKIVSTQIVICKDVVKYGEQNTVE